MSKNQKGFSIVEGVLIFVVVGLIGGVGWYVYKSNNQINQSLTNSSNTEFYSGQKLNQKYVGDTDRSDTEAQKWELVTSANNGFKVRIPDGWEVTNYGQSDNIRGDVTYVPGTKAKILVTENAYAGDSQVRFQVVQFKNTDKFQFVYGDETKTLFPLGKVSGTKYYKKYPLTPIDGIGPLPGQEDYIYEFKTDTKTTYVLYSIQNKNAYTEHFLKENYNQDASDPNQVQLIERVVRTLMINSST